MIPPTSIDGTDITGATIDGTDVQEITVDGDVVFPAQTLPVRYSDMIAWYPMERNISGGDEFSDATAIISGASDTTAYDLVNFGAVYEANEGVTDIIEGANSGSFENTVNSYLESSVPLSLPLTISFWYEKISGLYSLGNIVSNDFLYYASNANARTGWFSSSNYVFFSHSLSVSGYNHAAISIDTNGNATAVFNRDNTLTNTINAVSSETPLQLFNVGDARTSGDMEGYIDDLRIYDSDLSVNEIQQIYDNTEP